jgi:tetratricopeptide (TPR) repeat protein
MSTEDIYELLDRAYESEDADEIEELVQRALALEPDNPEALLLKSDLVEDDDERLLLLEKALEEARRYFQERNLSGEDVLEDEMGLVYLGLLQRTAYTLFFMERDDRALELVEELLRYDHEDLAMAKTLYYRILLEREEWTRVLEETMQETVRGLGWAYARVIATFMLSGDQGKGKKKHPEGLGSSLGNNLNKMLWDAVRMAPNVPFYMLGYIPDPVDESEDEDYHFAALFESVWSPSRGLLNWFSKATILFGLLTDRFGEESDDMREILTALGGGPDYEELKSRVAGSSDEKVLEALTAENCPRS